MERGVAIDIPSSLIVACRHYARQIDRIARMWLRSGTDPPSEWEVEDAERTRRRLHDKVMGQFRRIGFRPRDREEGALLALAIAERQYVGQKDPREWMNANRARLWEGKALRDTAAGIDIPSSLMVACRHYARYLEKWTRAVATGRYENDEPTAWEWREYEKERSRLHDKVIGQCRRAGFRLRTMDDAAFLAMGIAKGHYTGQMAPREWVDRNRAQLRNLLPHRWPPAERGKALGDTATGIDIPSSLMVVCKQYVRYIKKTDREWGQSDRPPSEREIQRTERERKRLHDKVMGQFRRIGFRPRDRAEGTLLAFAIAKGQYAGQKDPREWLDEERWLIDAPSHRRALSMEKTVADAVAKALKACRVRQTGGTGMGRGQQRLIDEIVAGLTRGRSRASGLKRVFSRSGLSPEQISLGEDLDRAGWDRVWFEGGDPHAESGDVEIIGNTSMDGKVRSWYVNGAVYDEESDDWLEVEFTFPGTNIPTSRRMQRVVQDRAARQRPLGLRSQHSRGSRSRASGLKQLSALPRAVTEMLRQIAHVGWRKPHLAYGTFLAERETREGEYNLAGEGPLEDIMEGKVRRWTVFGVVDDRDAEVHFPALGKRVPSIKEARRAVARALE